MVSHQISSQQQHCQRPVPIRATDDNRANGSNAQDSREPLELRVLGVYTARSLSSVDCALVHYRQDSPDTSPCLQVLQTAVIPIPTYITTQMFNVLRDTSKEASATTQFMIQLGQVHSAAIKSFCQRLNVEINFIDLIGSHSQAIELLELPLRGEAISPVSLATGIVIAAQTALTTVTDFAVEGQAHAQAKAKASASVRIDERFDNLLLRHKGKVRICLDIGLSTTLSLINPCSEIGSRPTPHERCHRGTHLVDIATHLLSKGSTLRDIRGTINHKIVDQCMQKYEEAISDSSSEVVDDPHCERLVRELIDECMFMAMPDHDTIATITRIIAESILQRYRTFVSAHVPKDRKVDEVFISGHGARNPEIVSHIRGQLPDTSVISLDTVGVPGTAKDAVSCAYLAIESAVQFDGILCTSEATTIADTVHGSVAPGPKWKKTMQEIAQFGQGRPVPVVSSISFKKHF